MGSWQIHRSDDTTAIARVRERRRGLTEACGLRPCVIVDALPAQFRSKKQQSHAVVPRIIGMHPFSWCDNPLSLDRPRSALHLQRRFEVLSAGLGPVRRKRGAWKTGLPAGRKIRNRTPAFRAMAGTMAARAPERLRQENRLVPALCPLNPRQASARKEKSRHLHNVRFLFFKLDSRRGA